MSNSDEDDIFEFRNSVSQEDEDLPNYVNISNDQHFECLKEISEAFTAKLAEKNNFDIFHTWNTYSDMEPIEINYENNSETYGVFDIVNSDSIIINKIISAITILSAEIQNVLGGNTINMNKFDFLYPLVVYGESDEEEEKIEDGEVENQIARMLPFFVEVFDKCTKLLSIAINLVNQMVSLYNKKTKSYNDSFKYVDLFKPFDYLGDILSFFNTIDTLVVENENLSSHWKIYRLMFQKCKSDPNKYGFTEDQAKKLEKVINRLDRSILSKKFLQSCVKHLVSNTGEMSIDRPGTFNPPSTNKEFTLHFANYLKNRINKFNNEIGSLTETDEKMQFYSLLSLFSYYIKVYEKDSDKNIFKSIWAIQKKVTDIPLISHVNFQIEKYLLSLMPWQDKNSQITLDPKNIELLKIDNFKKYLLTFKYFASNLRLQTFTWITRMESNIFNDKMVLKQEGISINIITLRIKTIINGLLIAFQIKNSLTYVLNTLLHEKIELTSDIIGPLCSLLELLKVIEHQFNKSKSIISLSIAMINRVLSNGIKQILVPVSKKINLQHNYKADVYNAIFIILSNLNACPSRLRSTVNEICFDIIRSKNFFQSSQMEDLNFNFWKLNLFQKLSTVIKTVCDCSFFYWYKDLIPECLSILSQNSSDFKRIYFFSIALSDTDLPLLHVKYLEDNTLLIKKYRENIFNTIVNNVGIKISREIENDLRMQTHSVIITSLNLPNPCKGEIKDWSKYLSLKPIPIFQFLFNLRIIVEDYLNRTFYDMTILNLNDWKTYQQMRVFSKTKYDLNLHNIYLPSQTLDQGVDILFILRNIVNFVQRYNFNLHSQSFIEVTKDNNYVSIIGVQQILNSLYTHGIGIVNTIVNKTYQFLGSLIKTIITQFIIDEYIKSSLMLEKRFWNDNKEKVNNKYPYERAESLCNDIKNVIKTKDESTLIDKLREFISQIGNALGFIRIIRTALMEFNSQNLKFFSNNSSENNNIEEIQKLLSSINLITEENNTDPFIINTFNSFTKTTKIFNDTLEILDQNKKNNINYLLLLVKSFDNVFTTQNVPDIDLFYFIIPAVTINWVENSIVAKDKIFKKNIKDAYFTDDGFILGLSYLLKVFKQESNFDALQWFQGVIEKLEKDADKFVTNSNKRSNDDTLQQNMSLRKINTYKNEFELLYFTYNSAMIVFNDY